MTDLDPGAFATHRATVRDGLELAYVHEGAGGTPLLVLHGWPETRRIWWRNIGPLAAGGFEVIAPDHPGFGRSETSDLVDDVADLSLFYLDLLDTLKLDRVRSTMKPTPRT